MLSDADRISRHMFRTPDVGEPMVIAIFAFRHDAHLVAGLVENIRPIVHGYACWDDRGDHGYHSNEPERRNALNAAAIDMGAAWILGLDPDERLEPDAGRIIPRLTADPEARVIWRLHLREMFSATEWRADGSWGAKESTRLYPVHAVKWPLTEALHGPWFNDGQSYERQSSPIWHFHFHHLSEARGRQRAAAYAAQDPERRFAHLGYDYLGDRRGMILQDVPPHRRCLPPFEDDGALRPVQVASVGPDPDPCLYGLIHASLQQFGAEAALIVAQDLLARDPDDSDLVWMVGELAALAGRMGDFPASDALWRRWTDSEARVFEGADNGKGKLAVVVIGFLAQEGLVAAVRSIRSQSANAEIVVVNTGGGDAAKVLATELHHIRLIDIETPHLVGTARNIGIDASTARYVAFLAGDCTALTGWVASRITAHEAGALTVSTPVVPSDTTTLTGAVLQIVHFYNRDPKVWPDEPSHFSRSYQRRVFAQAGYFPTGLYLGEDNWLNRQADRLAPPVWVPDAVTLHANPPSFAALLSDARERAKRQAKSALRTTSWADDVVARISRRPASGLSVPDDAVLAQALEHWAQALREGAEEVEELDVEAVTADVMFGAADTDAALERLDQVLADWPESAPILLLKAQIAALAGQVDVAIAACRAALNIQPDLADPVEFAVQTLFAADRPDEALTFARRACIQSPLTALHHSTLADALERLGQTEDALAAGRRALMLDSHVPQTHAAVAKLHQALGNEQQAARRQRIAQMLKDQGGDKRKRGLRN